MLYSQSKLAGHTRRSKNVTKTTTTETAENINRNTDEKGNDVSIMNLIFTSISFYTKYLSC